MTDLVLDLNGYTDLPAGKIAYVVTFLEMTQPASVNLSQPAAHPNVELERWTDPDPQSFRTLFREIGEEWLWFSRLVIPESQLKGMLNDPLREIYVPVVDGKRSGLLELNYQDPANPEISYFGLVPTATGGGMGRWLMANAVSMAWARPETTRLWLHTCTGDSPQAIHFYQACGFKPYKRAIEVCDDPRRTGHLSRESARHVPIIE